MAFMSSFKSMFAPVVAKAQADARTAAIQKQQDTVVFLQTQKELWGLLESGPRTGPYGKYVKDQTTADQLNSKISSMQQYVGKYGGSISDVKYSVAPAPKPAPAPTPTPAADSIPQSEIVAQAATRRTISQTRRRTHPENYLNTDSIEGQLLTGTVKYRNLLGI